VTEVVIDGVRYLPFAQSANPWAPPWRPIATAPKDGTALLLCQAFDADGDTILPSDWGVHVQVAAWWGGEKDWIVYCNLMMEPTLHFTPTHWAPLPGNPLLVDQGP
jgi:hypothetical protein